MMFLMIIKCYILHFQEKYTMHNGELIYIKEPINPETLTLQIPENIHKTEPMNIMFCQNNYNS